MAKTTEVYSSTPPLTLALDGGGCSTPRPGRFTPGGDPVAIVYVAGWAPGSVWTGAEKHASTRIRSPDRPARSESPYRLHCTGPHFRTAEEWTESICVVILRDGNRIVRHASCTTFATNPTRIARQRAQVCTVRGWRVTAWAVRTYTASHPTT